jgi:hypothetical protein
VWQAMEAGGGVEVQVLISRSSGASRGRGLVSRGRGVASSEVKLVVIKERLSNILRMRSITSRRSMSYATGVCGLKLLVYERLSATSV